MPLLTAFKLYGIGIGISIIAFIMEQNFQKIKGIRAKHGIEQRPAKTYSIKPLVGKTIQKIKGSETVKREEEKLKRELLKRQRELREATKQLETANRQLKTRLDKIKTTQTKHLEA